MRIVNTALLVEDFRMNVVQKYQEYGEPIVPKLQMAGVNLQSLVQNY